MRTPNAPKQIMKVGKDQQAARAVVGAVQRRMVARVTASGCSLGWSDIQPPSSRPSVLLIPPAEISSAAWVYYM